MGGVLEIIMEILLFILTLLIMKIDLKKLYIPNILNFLFLIGVIVYKGNDIENSVIGAGIYPLPLIILYGYVSDLLKKEVVGFGDIKFMISIGYLLGYTDFYDLYFFYFLAFLLGGIYGVVLLIIRKENREVQMPFSPFLILALYIVLWKGLWKKMGDLHM